MWEFLGFPERLGRINDVLYIPEVAVEFWWFLSAGDFFPLPANKRVLVDGT